MANINTFEKTQCKTIALEITAYDSYEPERKINYSPMSQLIRVLNYAHDQGGRRVILINQTGLSPEQLLVQIKKQLPVAERERTWSRFMLLLCETEKTIFEFDQFNDLIEEPVVPEKKSATQNADTSFNRLLTSLKESRNRFSTDSRAGKAFNSRKRIHFFREQDESEMQLVLKTGIIALQSAIPKKN